MAESLGRMTSLGMTFCGAFQHHNFGIAYLASRWEEVLQLISYLTSLLACES